MLELKIITKNVMYIIHAFFSFMNETSSYFARFPLPERSLTPLRLA